jgi:transposase-like protein
VAEQRYQAVLAVIEDGVSVTEVAAKVGVSQQTVHGWLSRYAAGGLEGLVDRSHGRGAVRIRWTPWWSCGTGWQSGAEQVGEGEIFEALQRRGAEVGAELADDRSRLPAGGYPFESGSAR